LATRPRLSAALHGITAAVVGVILNLSLWFALNVLFGSVPRMSWGPVALPVPDVGSLDFTALALTLVAGVLIFRMKLGMATVLMLMAVAGLAAHFI
jgi:chromate transporter